MYRSLLKNIIILILILGAFSLLYLFDFNDGKKTTSTAHNLASMNFTELSEYFTDLAHKEGAEYAFSVLRDSTLRGNIDIHLLGHVIGDELYIQEGIEGMKICTRDFRNACSHSVVIGTFLDQGLGALPRIAEACREAPGGSGAYTMCFHGFGHGVLAYTDYELPKAVSLCKEVGTPEYNNREYIECVGGAVMEMIGGVHDPVTRIEKSQKYFSKEDPLYTCSSDFIPTEVKPICYTYLTPYLFEAAGGNLGNPQPRDFKKTFEFCDALDETENREACFGGLGKEFVVLVQDRDIRNVTHMTEAQFKKIADWCSLSSQEDGVRSCLLSALFSLYWGGENDKKVPITFCNILTNPLHKEMCFSNLIGAVSFYISDIPYRKDFCSDIPTSYQQSCDERLLDPIP